MIDKIFGSALIILFKSLPEKSRLTVTKRCISRTFMFYMSSTSYDQSGHYCKNSSEPYCDAMLNAKHWKQCKTQNFDWLVRQVSNQKWPIAWICACPTLFSNYCDLFWLGKTHLCKHLPKLVPMVVHAQMFCFNMAIEAKRCIITHILSHPLLRHSPFVCHISMLQVYT